MILDEKLKGEKNFNVSKRENKTKHKKSIKNNPNSTLDNELDDDTNTSFESSSNLSLELDDDGNPVILSDDEKRLRKIKKRQEISDNQQSEIVNDDPDYKNMG